MRSGYAIKDDGFESISLRQWISQPDRPEAKKGSLGDCQFRTCKDSCLEKETYLIQVGHRFDSLGSLELQRNRFRLIPDAVHGVTDHLTDSQALCANSSSLRSQGYEVLSNPLASRIAHRLSVRRVRRNGFSVDWTVVRSNGRDSDRPGNERSTIEC